MAVEGGAGAAEGEGNTGYRRSPAEFLKGSLGRPVKVKLNTGEEYRGVLACLDGYMNLCLEQCEEYSEGQLVSRYAECFIRGNNVFYLAGQQA